jgi:quinol monooxygenase YgiN
MSSLGLCLYLTIEILLNVINIQSMIVEYIRYKLQPEQFAAFEEAYINAEEVLNQSPNFLGYEITKGSDEPNNYIVRIHWDSVEGHLSGFRKGAAFPPFYQLVKPFFNNIEEMKHYDVVHSTLPITGTQS